MAKTQFSDDYRALALLPLRDVVVYPHMVLPLFVGAPNRLPHWSRQWKTMSRFFLLAQKKSE